MARFTGIALLALAVLVVGPPSAHAVDQGVLGKKLLVKRSASGKEKMVLILKDPTLLFPTIGGADDPSTAGMRVELFSGTGERIAFDLPPGLGKPGWKAKPAKRNSYSFTNRDAPAGISDVRAAKIKEGRLLKIVAKRTGLALAGPQSTVAVRVTTGTLRSCAIFDGLAIQKDEANQFKARNATTLPADCGAESLGGTVQCGDGFVDAPEECDGAGTCSTFELTCLDPGHPNECTCSGCATCPKLYGCCEPAVFIPAPGLCAGSCIPTTCTPPNTCNPGSQCLPNETCCAPAGTGCAVPTLGVSLLPCCPGAECRKPGFLEILCCAPDGTACTTDDECCSDSCGAGGTCDTCLPIGAACTSSLRCCSYNCGASGTCECAGAGIPCTSSADCCSGNCNVGTGFCSP